MLGRNIRIMLGIVILLLVAVVTWRMFVFPWKLNLIERRVAKIQGATISASGGYADIVLEEVWIELAISGGRVLRLWDLDRKSFEDGGKFSVQRIGPWTPAVNRDNQPRVPDSLYFGETEEGRALFPAVRSVADLVSNYDAIAKVVEGWPACPEIATGQDRTGSFTYCRRPYGRGGQPGNSYTPPW